MKLPMYIAALASLLMTARAEAEPSHASSNNSTRQSLTREIYGPYAAPRNCPEGYAGVPGDREKLVDGNQKGVRGFCIAKIEMKHPTDENVGFVVNSHWSAEWDWRPDTTSIPTTTSKSRPWILISYQEAVDACSRIKSPDFSYSLISSYEWYTVSESISNTYENWSGKQVASGELSKGFRILDINHRDDATFLRNYVCAWRTESRDYCAAPLPVSDIWNVHSDLSTSIGDSETEQFVQNRTHMLSNGQTIWEFGGNVSEWVIPPSSFGKEFARGGNFSDVSTDIYTKIDVPNLPDKLARKMHSTDPRQTFVGFRCVAHPVQR
ncbi:MAG: hypothetical protein WCI18_04585 [Pseudomonadota bacterium]